MPGLFPRLSEQSRRALVIVAAVLGGAAVLYAVWKRDYTAAAVIGATLAVLLGTWAWSRAERDGDGDGQPRA